MARSHLREDRLSTCHVSVCCPCWRPGGRSCMGTGGQWMTEADAGGWMWLDGCLPICPVSVAAWTPLRGKSLLQGGGIRWKICWTWLKYKPKRTEKSLNWTVYLKGISLNFCPEQNRAWSKKINFIIKKKVICHLYLNKTKKKKRKLHVWTSVLMIVNYYVSAMKIVSVMKFQIQDWVGEHCCVWK